jgi:hypothetical protein
MNPTLPQLPRALAAAVAALALALAVALFTPAITGDLSARLADRPAASQTSAPEADSVPPATWAYAPFASPLDTLREVPR